MILSSEFILLKKGDKLFLSKKSGSYEVGSIFYFDSANNIVDMREKMIDLRYNNMEVRVMEKFFIEYFETSRGFRERRIESIFR